MLMRAGAQKLSAVAAVVDHSAANTLLSSSFLVAIGLRPYPPGSRKLARDEISTQQRFWITGVPERREFPAAASRLLKKTPKIRQLPARCLGMWFARQHADVARTNQ